MATATPLTPTAPGAARPAPVTQVRPPSAWSCWSRATACDRCYAREMLVPMSIGLIAIMLVMAGNFVYWAINSIVNRGMAVGPVLRLFMLAAPGFAVQGVPAGVILAVCLVLNRAVRDNEIIALRVGGAPLPRIMVPFLLMALLASAFDWVVVEKVAPRTNDMAQKTLMHLMSQSVAPMIESDKYFRAGNYYFYVQYVEHNVLHNVMVYERGSGNFTAADRSIFPSVMIAGKAYESPRNPNQWILENGVHHMYRDDGSQLSETHFDRLTINVAQELSTLWDDQKEPFAMDSGELWGKIKAYSNSSYDQNKVQEWMVDYYRRFSLPLACFVMALLAAPLALRYARHGSFAGLVLAFALAFLWQGFDGWFRALGIAGYLPALSAAWLTNILFAVGGVTLLWFER